MNLRHAFAATTLSVLIAAPVLAQHSTSHEEARIDFDNPGFEVYVPKSTVTFGLRILSSGASVNFRNLGIITMRPVGLSEDGTIRDYDNGALAIDSLRTDLIRGEVQRNANGEIVLDSQGKPIQTSTQGGRYNTTITGTDGTVTTTGDYLSYTPGQTRAWTYATDGQIVGNHLALSNYGAVSEGASAKKDQGLSGGIELQLSRALGKIGQRIEWSLTAGLALNDISAKTGGTVTSTLLKHTDYYQFIGSNPADGVRTAPAFGDYVNPVNGGIFPFSRETTPALRDSPTAGMSTDTTTVGGASIQGNWQIKGAYALLRLGPTLRAQLSENFGLSASVGFAGAYAGSRYSVLESLSMPDLAEPVVAEDSSTESKFLPGFYADLTLDWVANERSALFAGLTMQQFGEYDQSVGGRTAKIDLGNSVGLRGGISVRF